MQAKTTFNQTTSVIKRLRAMLIAIAIFFLIGTFGIYFSSADFLTGLQEINNDNKVLALTSNALEVLSSSEEKLEKLDQSTELKIVEFSFNENLKVVEEKISEATLLELPVASVPMDLKKALSSVKMYRQTASPILARLSKTFKKTKAGLSDEMSGEVLVAKQFVTEAKESLRKIQIDLKSHSEVRFSTIFKNRFRPLIITTSLSVLFFTFVILVGFSNTRRMQVSISNLTNATDVVSEGDLNYRARIIEKDEIGNLTHEFNHMVHTLRENQTDLRLTLERITKLQNITGLFAEAVTSAEVYEIIFGKVFDSLGAVAGGVAVLTPDRKNLEIKKVQGYDSSVMNAWQIFPLDSNVPVAQTVSYNKAFFYGEMDSFNMVFPELKTTFQEAKIQSFASLPLKLGPTIVGGLSLSFSGKHSFDVNEQEFLYAMARQCAQAIHRSQLYEDARQAIQARDEFLSIASHELRTPLTPLKLQFQSLIRQVKKGDMAALTPEKLLKVMQSSDRQINRLTSLIDDLLDVSRISSGKLTLTRESFDLAEMVREVVEQYSHHLLDLKSKVEIVKSESITGSFDKVRIEQVLVNFLTNAAKYAPGKPIFVSLYRRGNIAVMEVKDMGPGIAPENQQRIFDRFERVKEKDNVGGLGLGLYISKQIIEAHEGKISLQSHPGEGATFIVELPV